MNLFLAKRLMKNIWKWRISYEIYNFLFFWYNSSIILSYFLIFLIFLTFSWLFLNFLWWRLWLSDNCDITNIFSLTDFILFNHTLMSYLERTNGFAETRISNPWRHDSIKTASVSYKCLISLDSFYSNWDLMDSLTFYVILLKCKVLGISLGILMIKKYSTYGSSILLIAYSIIDWSLLSFVFVYASLTFLLYPTNYSSME